MSEYEWLDIFADNLVDILKDARMSQNELADITGLSRSTVSKYINKKAMPGVKALINISEAVNVSLDELMFFDDVIE